MNLLINYLIKSKDIIIILFLNPFLSKPYIIPHTYTNNNSNRKIKPFKIRYNNLKSWVVTKSPKIGKLKFKLKLLLLLQLK